MGAGVSDWRLARAVSSLGQLGVVSGTGMGGILARRLQDGDPGGHMRNALASFPFPSMVKRIVDKYFLPDGRAEGQPYRQVPMYTLEQPREAVELCILGNYAEVWLARQTHDHPVGINYLEKIQLPHLPSIYGAMLAGVGVVIMGAGIPLDIPAALDALASHAPAEYPVLVTGAKPNGTVRLRFDPREVWEPGTSLEPLTRPDFLPIVSSDTLARMLARRTAGGVQGFVVEHHIAGGHNAPPRGNPPLSADGQATYGDRDEINLDGIRRLGLPFWLAGGYGSPEGLRRAQAAGAAGVQAGSAFALCTDSGLAPDARRALVLKALRGEALIKTDGRASPTGFPFKVANLEGSLSEEEVYARRRRICDLGMLREPYIKPDGTIGYRCPGEPEEAFVAKGGDPDDLTGRKCLCNALIANVGMPQILGDGSTEKLLVTLGDDVSVVKHFCSLDNPDYPAATVIRVLLAAASGEPPAAESAV